MVKHALLVETILQIDVVSLKHYKKKQVTSDNMLWDDKYTEEKLVISLLNRSF